MKRSNVLKILKAMSAAQRQVFTEYVGKNEGSGNTCQVLATVLAEIDGQHLTSSRAISEKTAISASQVRNCISRIRKHLDQHFALLALDNDKYLRKALSLKRALDTGNELYFRILQKEMDEMIEAKPSIDFLSLIRYHQISNHFYSTVKNTISVESIYRYQRVLDRFCSAEREKIHIRLRSIEFLQNGELPTDLAEAASSPDTTEDDLYSEIEKLVTEEAHESYVFLMDKLKKNVVLPHTGLLIEVITVINNFLIRKINLGHNKYLADFTDLIDYTQKSDLNVFNEWSVKNSITILCRNGETDKAETFLYDNIDKIPKDRKPQSLKYNEGVIMRYRGDFDGARKKFNAQEITDEVYYLGSRYNVINILYSEQDYSGAISLLISLKRYLIRSSHIKDVVLKSNLTFIKYFTGFMEITGQAKLLRRKDYDNKLRALLDAVERTDNVLTKSWLTTQIKARISEVKC